MSRPMNSIELRTQINDLGRFSTKELVDELSKRDGVREINLKMTCAQDFRGYDRCLVVKE